MGVIVVAVIAAVGGFAVGWVSRPAAQVAAEERRLKTEQRRRIVADVRELLAERYADEDLGMAYMEADQRFLAIRRHLPETRDGYDLEIIAAAVDALEDRWDLI